MKIAVYMDPLDQLNPERDASLTMLSAARARGWSCVYFTSQDLFAEDGAAFAQVMDIEVNDTATQWVLGSSKQVQALTEFDIIFIRQDPPFDLSYLYATQLLNLAAKQGVLVTNNPQSLRDMNEKLSILQFPECCPPTLVASDIARLKLFWNTHQSVIFKPLDAMGGHNVFHVGEDGRNLMVILQLLTVNQTVPIMAQRYIQDITRVGDKRIILINGEPVPYALARFLAAGESRANLAAGGQGKVVPITPRDRFLCETIAPTLQAKGLYFVGIDVIGDYITEINVTSPTCIREITAATGIDIVGPYLDLLTDMVR